MSESRRDGTLSRRALGGFLWMAWGKGGQIVMQLVVLAVLARLLTPADFGVVSAAVVVIGATAVFAQLGLGPALVQHPDLEQRHVDTAFLTTCGLGLLLGALIYLTAPLTAAFFKMPTLEPVLHVLALIFPVQSLGVVSEWQIRRDLDFRWIANRDVAAYVLGYGGVGIPLAAAGAGVWALVWATMGQAVVKTAILLWARPPHLPPRMEKEALRELMYFGGGFTVAKLANYVAVQGDNLIVGRYLGPAALGFYGRAYSLMSAPASGFGAVLDAVLFPAMARVQDQPERLAAAYRRGVALIALLVLPTSAALVLIAPEVVAVLLGEGWDAVVLPFQVLGVGMLFRTSYKMSDSIARSTGAVYRRAWRQILYAALVLVGAWVGQFWGIVGVAAGALAALTVNFLLMAHLSLQLAHISARDYLAAHGPAALATVAILPPVLGVVLLLRSGGAAPWLVVMGTGATLAVGGLLMAWKAPDQFVGPDGLWLARLGWDYLRDLMRRALAVIRSRRPGRTKAEGLNEQ